MSHENHYVIIMAGGIGSRFWPMSRSTFPKQFHDILGRGKTLIQETFDRFTAFIPTENIYIVTNEQYRDLVMQQLPAITSDQVLLEPVGRNTAPCVAYAAYKIQKKNPEASFVVAPADHLIQKEEVFKDAVELGLSACDQEDMIMTLGITPTRPDTGYGYIQFIEDEKNHGYYQVKTFTEKPELEVAKAFLDSGDYVWNGGLFIFSWPTIRRAFEAYLPDMAEAFGSIQASYYTAGESQAIADTYSSCQNISIDYGIMEQADKDDKVYVIPADFGWSDLGTWGSVHDNSDKDPHHNAVHGQAILYDAGNNIVKTTQDGKLVVLKGLQDFIVVDTDDALLICHKSEEQFIKKIVGDLKGKWEGQFV